MPPHHLARRRALLTTPSPLRRYPIVPIIVHPHHQSSSSTAPSSSTSPQDLPPRWLSDLRQRVGKCILFGLNQIQVKEAGSILQEVVRGWRELLAGSEGFLTGKGRAGLEGQKVVWGEMDVMGHVNNVTYIRYAESARINWAHNFATTIDPAHKNEWSELWTPKGDGLILRSIKTDFKFPMAWPDSISVYHKLRDLPSDSTESFKLNVLILSERHQRPAARCVEDIVVYDYRQGKKARLRPFMLEQFRETFALQEEAQRTNSERVRRLLERVRGLERETWDQEDAKEDMGSVGGTHEEVR